MGLRILLPLLAAASLLGMSSAQCSGPRDIVFVVDSSGSIVDTAPANDRQRNVRLLKEFMIDVVDGFVVSSTTNIMAVLDYGNIGYQKSISNSNPIFRTTTATIKADINGLSNRGENTNTSSGIYMGHYDYFRRNPRIDRTNVADLMVIITDGVSTYSSASTVPFAEEVRRQGIQVISIGVGTRLTVTTSTELQAMSSAPQVSTLWLDHGLE